MECLQRSADERLLHPEWNFDSLDRPAWTHCMSREEWEGRRDEFCEAIGLPAFRLHLGTHVSSMMMHMVTCSKGPWVDVETPDWLYHGPLSSFLHHDWEADAVLKRHQDNGWLMETWSRHLPVRPLVKMEDVRSRTCAEVVAELHAQEDEW